jgi:DNA-binding beta-propeller fold protein YncE
MKSPCALAALVGLSLPVVFAAGQQSPQRRPGGANASIQAEEAIDFRPVTGFLKLPAGMKLGPCSGVDIDRRGNVYVIQRQAPPILCFDASGKFLRSWGTPQIGRDPDMQGPHAIRIDQDDFVWTVDRQRHLVRKFDPSGQLVLTLGTEGSSGTGPNQFNRPADVAFGPDGAVYVADGYGNSRVVKFDRTGSFLKTWGDKGNGPGQFDLPHAIAIGPDGLVYVCDRYNGRIQIFDTEGNLKRTWTGLVPVGLAFDVRGNLFVADGVSQVMQLDGQGKIKKTWGKKPEELGLVAGQKSVPPISDPGGFRFVPHLISVDGQGSLYLADVPNQMLHQFKRIVSANGASRF